MRLKTAYIFLALLLYTGSNAAKKEQPIYLDASRPIKERVNDLMSRMTLEDKIAQMCQFVGLEHMRAAEKDITEEELINGHARGFYKGLHSDGVERMVKEGRIGSFLHVTSIEEANHLQALAEQSPLKIPVLIGIDAIHGNGLYRGSTIYPSPIGAAAAFSPELWREASRQTATEMRATGSHWAFTPNIEIARDARWGRVGETFGEDPYLVSRMGVAAVQGLQTDNLANEGAVIACVKHLLGGGTGNNGTNASPVEMSEGTMRNIYLPPFKTAIEEAAPYSLMPAHNEVNGIPCHSNGWLMTDIIRNEYGFKGFIISDWMDIEAICRKHRTATDNADAFRQSVNAGIDMHMHGPEFAAPVKEMVEQGLIPMSRIDEACSKILTAKFALGLFENKYVDKKKAEKTVFCKEHRNTALEIARRSIVLLKNENLLPLDRKNLKRILVTGPNADNQSIMGDWVFDQPRENVCTVLDGIKEKAGDVQVDFVDVGWNLRTMSKECIGKAVKAAGEADVAIVVIGEDSFREHWKEKTCGENRDRADITLWGRQQELIESIAATGTPVVAVLVNGRPLATPWIAENIPAIIEAWEPGSTGGTAVAEVLFGEFNPSGKLPITIPRHVGQITTVYNHKPSQYSHAAIDVDKTPLYCFGYGLSYTEFKYSDMALDHERINRNEVVKATVKVTNTGNHAGEEVVQMYIRDDFSQTSRPVKELKAFRRISLQPGETKIVEFVISAEDLAYFNNKAEYVIKDGTYTVMIGKSSDNKDLITKKFTLK